MQAVNSVPAECDARPVPSSATQLGFANIYCVPGTKGYRMDRKVVCVLEKLPGWRERRTEADGVRLRIGDDGAPLHPAWAGREAHRGLLGGGCRSEPTPPSAGPEAGLASRIPSLSSWSNFFWVGEPSVCIELRGRGGGAGIGQNNQTRLFR